VPDHQRLALGEPTYCFLALVGIKLARLSIQIAQTEMPKQPKRPKPQQVTAGAETAAKTIDSLSRRSVEFCKFRDLFDQRRLTIADMKDYAQRRLSIADLKDYAQRANHGSRTAELMTTASD
jgi:hypothetical protein